MVQAYASQAAWNKGKASGSLCNVLKEVVRVNECQTAYVMALLMLKTK